AHAPAEGGVQGSAATGPAEAVPAASDRKSVSLQKEQAMRNVTRPPILRLIISVMYNSLIRAKYV
ncbi:MAG: hypothetical protein D6698_06665, partial [Gammaproteobacteria bacterium]